jgi:hypothetical protein
VNRESIKGTEGADKPEKLVIVPVSFSDACAFVDQYHRHHRAPQGHKFSVGLALGEYLVGGAIVGGPVAR